MTLGLRSQALKLKFVSPRYAGAIRSTGTVVRGDARRPSTGASARRCPGPSCY
ncbi:MAG: hypothetical protein MZV70_51595 [Desulfobacterales bacterium]|nr:hypothetical protein [Desulfobacterales bacterium]